MAIDQAKISRILGSTTEPAEADVVSQVMRGRSPVRLHPLPLRAVTVHVERGDQGFVFDANGDLVATTPTPAAAEWLVALSRGGVPLAGPGA